MFENYIKYGTVAAGCRIALNIFDFAFIVPEINNDNCFIKYTETVNTPIDEISIPTLYATIDIINKPEHSKCRLIYTSTVKKFINKVTTNLTDIFSIIYTCNHYHIGIITIQGTQHIFTHRKHCNYSSPLIIASDVTIKRLDGNIKFTTLTETEQINLLTLIFTNNQTNLELAWLML